MTYPKLEPRSHLPVGSAVPAELSALAKSSPFGRLVFLVVFALSALYMAHELKRGWIPSDDGVLAESAEQVLHGALPHRDYHELYTGLLSYVNAAAFRVLGTNIGSMRYVMFLFFLPWVSAFYYSASKFVSAAPAAATTLLAVVWALPNCATPMPSWYNLFFATFGLAAILRYIDVEKKRWLFNAGLCGGISFLFKMTGLYFVAAVLFFLAFREQTSEDSKPTQRSSLVLYRIFLPASVVLYEALLFALLRPQANRATYLYFWVPNLAIGATIVWYEFRSVRSRGSPFIFLFRESALFGVGFALPIVMFLSPYLWTRSLSPAAADFLIQPVQMIRAGSLKPPEHWFLEGIAVNLILIGGARLTSKKTRLALWEQILLVGMPVALLVAATLILAQRTRIFYQLAWSTVWVLAPLVVVLGAGMLVRRKMMDRLEPARQQRLFIAFSLASSCSLIQFPFTDTIYYCYVAPLVFLAATALLSMMERPPRFGISGMVCFCLLYAVFELTPGFVTHLGVEYAPDTQTVRLVPVRGGGLKVTPATAQEYERLDNLIRQHARGEYILAAPNCPQVYFLSNLRPPTRDFSAFSDDVGLMPEKVLSNLDAHHVNLIVLNHLNSMFVQPVPDDLQRALEHEFPSHAETENFEVRWKQ
jgi:hypothetical protein